MKSLHRFLFAFLALLVVDTSPARPYAGEPPVPLQQQYPPPPNNKLPDEVLAAFKSATSIVLYSLQPAQPVSLQKPEKEGPFHGHTVLGKVELSQPRERQQAVAALTSAIENGTGLIANCFNPHHALSVMAGATNYDVVICYECLQPSCLRATIR